MDRLGYVKCIKFNMVQCTERYICLGLLTYLVKVEWEISSDGAIETRLQEGRPPVTETMRSAPVVFTDSRHARVDGLRTRKLRLVNFAVESVRRENFIFLPLLPKKCVTRKKDERTNEEI